MADTAPDTRPLRHRPLIDGLRGLLIALMVGYHLGGLTAPTGGWIGLGTFFVLSGYLITTILLVEHERTGRIAYGTFLARRARRLAPALLVTLVGVVVVGSILRVDGTALRDDSLASLFYVANWRFVVTDQSYFASFAVSPLRHMWSLAVEEQFYAVWPFVVLGLLTFVGRRRLPIVLVAGVAASALWMRFLVGGSGDTSRAYYGTDARAQELLLGALLAVLVVHVPHSEGVRRAASAIGTVGLVAYGVLVFTLPADAVATYRQGGFLLAAVIGAMIVYGCSRTDTGPLAWLLGTWVFQALGARSYSLYLVHWPVIVFLDHNRLPWTPWALDLTRLLVALAITEVVHRLVEVPIHQRKVTLPRPGLTLLGSAAATAVVVLVASGLAGDDGLQDLPDDSALVVAADPTDDTTTDGVPAAGADHVVVLGDSQAWVLLEELPADVGIVASGAHHARCDITGQEIYAGSSIDRASDDCPGWPDLWDAALASVDEPDAVVVTLGLRQLFDLRVDGERVAVGTDEWEERYRADLARAVAVIRDRTDAPVVWMDVACYRWGDAAEVTDAERLATVNAVLADQMDEEDGVTVAPYAERVCTGSDGTETQDAIRPDGAHLSPDAAADTWAWIGTLIDDLR